MRSETIGIEPVSTRALGAEDQSFYSNYRWALNPFLKFDELISRMRDELNRHRRRDERRREEESRINLYLFPCAIDCTLDDYLRKESWHIRPLVSRYPRLSGVIKVSEGVSTFFSSVAGDRKLKELRKWKEGWDRNTETICRLLVDSRNLSSDEFLSIGQALDMLGDLTLPAALGRARMKINEGFRCQDLSYQDVLTLGNRYLANALKRNKKFVIVGARTAGSYLCPLLKVYLESKGACEVSWIALRPKFGLHAIEKRWLGRELAEEADVILVDDFSNTGKTFRMLEEIVKSFGVPARRMTILAPIHPHKLIGELPSDNQVRVIILNHDDLYMKSAMEPGKVETLLRDYYRNRGARSVTIDDNPTTDKINRELWSHYADSYQVRLKRVYDVTIMYKGGTAETTRILGKAVGSGWLGYHAYFAGVELRDFVPNFVALRHGILFREWVNGVSLRREDLCQGEIEEMARYLSARTKKLILKEDPKSEPPYLGWGWLEILAILRQAYGRLLGYPKNGILLQRLKRALHSPPTLVDGRMRLNEWLATESGIVKTDFEHHNFGPPELDVVDPAYDIAISSFEFPLSEDEEEKMIESYSRESGDVLTLRERVFLYKLLYSAAESDRMVHTIAEGKGNVDRELFHLRYLRGWNFRTFSMCKFTASLLQAKCDGTSTPGSPLFFMDLDGVFDSGFLGFPHTTVMGLKALALLCSKGYTIIPVTGRSVEHVRSYCRNYGFAAGIGEYGSVLFDNALNLEISLNEDSVREEIGRCKEVFAGSNDIFVDPDYKYSVRVMRYSRHGTVGLVKEEAKSVLKQAGLRMLRPIIGGADTYFVGNKNNKGTAVKSYMEYASSSSRSTIATGDSDEDIPMFENVALAFAPANASEKIKYLSRQGKCKVVSGNMQNGLLEIAESLVGARKNAVPAAFLKTFAEDSLQSLMIDLLSIANYPLYKRAISLLYRNKLGPGVN